MTADPARPASSGQGRASVPAQSAGTREPAPFAAEIRAAVRYERGLALKAVLVLAALAVVLLLRALYLT